MPCTESMLHRGLPWLAALLLAACGLPSAPPVAPPVTTPGAAPVTTPEAPPAAPAPAPAAADPARPPQAARPAALQPPEAARNWAAFKLQAARRLVQAHPDGTYLGPVPEPLLAIPVLEVELNADGSVRRVSVMRHPGQARDTTQLAIAAVHRAAPYGAMTHLPRPWKWTEVFLFDNQRRFKPRELDRD